MMYKIDLIPTTRSTLIRASEGDTGARRFTFALRYLSSEYLLTAETVTFQMANGAEHPCQILDGMAVLDCYADMTAHAGLFRCKLKIEDSTGTIYSSGFLMEVEETA